MLMQPIPDDILNQFNAVLEQKAVLSSLRDDCRKWLRYYLDFLVKYPPPDAKSEQMRLFIEKMRSQGKSGKSLHYAAHALSLFFSLQTPKKQAVVHAEKPAGFLTPPAVSRSPCLSSDSICVLARERRANFTGT
jgi:hypothetical protein